ncbi:MAG: phasin, PhaP [Alphaproteobacteria bacterium]|nr:phasin, PhaP [Alphaproteobacteria bacterium]
MAKQSFENPFEKLFQDMPVDMTAFSDVFKNSAALSEKFSNVVLAAAEKNAEISSKWTKDTLAKLADVAKAQNEPTDYSNAVTAFASESVEAASEHVAAFAEVAKKVQAETVELVLAAGKEAQAEATAAIKTATNKTAEAVKKTTAKAA